jgi:single-stranded-DNA-specific exonuclease
MKQTKLSFDAEEELDEEQAEKEEGVAGDEGVKSAPSAGAEDEGRRAGVSAAERKREESEKKGDYDGFFLKAREIGELVLSFDEVLVAHDYDCDGITTGAIVCAALRKQGKKFETHVILKKINDEIMQGLLKDGKQLVFCDVGAGQLDVIKKHAPNAIIIDHHPPVAEHDLMVNPVSFGFSSATDASASTVAYYCFKHLDDRLLARLAIVGAVGDMQDHATGYFSSLNDLLAKEAMEKEWVFISKDLRMFGRVSRGLVSFLQYSTEPFLPGLTSNAKACALFLEENGIPLQNAEGKWQSYYDLSVFDRRKLASALINYAASKGLPQKTIKMLVGDVYLFLDEPEKSVLRDAIEFSTLLNACGRHEHADVGIKACLGDAEALKQADSLLIEHRRAISQGIAEAKKHTGDMGAFLFLDGRGKVSATVVGTVAGAFFNSGLFDRSKPVIAFALDEEGFTKVSGRGCRELVDAGLDLGEVMRKASAEVGGEGGGHNVAAGAFFPGSPESDLKFLKKAKEVIEIQLQLK